jgi:hypothetical protein
MRVFHVTLVLAGTLAVTAAGADQTCAGSAQCPADKTTAATKPAAPTKPATAAATAPTTTAPKAMVIVGSTSCFMIRECALGQTPQQRADQILDVFNKYLGGSKATFAMKPAGKNTLITMNKDKLIVVTPQDVKTANAKNVAQLAAQWKTRLAKAFDETKAVK